MGEAARPEPLRNRSPRWFRWLYLVLLNTFSLSLNRTGAAILGGNPNHARKDAPVCSLADLRCRRSFPRRPSPFSHSLSQGAFRQAMGRSVLSRLCADLFQAKNQPVFLLLILCNAFLLLSWHLTSPPPSPLPSPSLALSTPSSCEVCIATPDDPLCLEYGLDNIRLSRAFEGSGYRVRRFVEKALRGEEVSIGVIGASVSQGHGLDGAPTWHAVFLEGLRTLFPKVVIYDGSAAAMDSEWCSLLGLEELGAETGSTRRCILLLLFRDDGSRRPGYVPRRA